MKRKLKKKVFVTILILCITVLFSIVLFLPYMIVDVKLIGNKNIVLNYGEEYDEPGFKAKMFGKNITKDIKVSNNIKEALGNYEVIYSYKLVFYNVKYTRKVMRKDVEGPKIVLISDEKVEVVLGEEFTEPGFKAVDNKDGDVTDKVKVSGSVDTKTLGSYKLTYKVSDYSGNENVKVRTVNVALKSPTTMSIEEFSLAGWYDDVKLKETADMGDEYFNRITVVGDSNIMHMYQEGYLNGKRAWAKPCLHVDSMINEKLNIYGEGISINLLEALKTRKPDIMIIYFGAFSTGWINYDIFMESANKLIEKVKELSPNTKIVLMSIFPILKDGPNINSFDQQKINSYNFSILELANKYKLKYLDVEEVLKDETGYANPRLYQGDGYHTSSYGNKIVKNYIKTHALEE